MRPRRGCAREALLLDFSGNGIERAAPGKAAEQGPRLRGCAREALRLDYSGNVIERAASGKAADQGHRSRGSNCLVDAAMAASRFLAMVKLVI